MSKFDKVMSKKVEDLDTDGVVDMLERWDMGEFVEFARKKHLDGRKLLDVSEGIVKLWRPKSNTKKFMNFINDLRENPEKYFEINETVESDNFNVEGSNPDMVTSVKTEIDTDENILNPQDDDENDTDIAVSKVDTPKITVDIESQYQTVTVRKRVQNTTSTSHNTISSVEELIKKLVPAKSFLYRNQQKTQGSPSYLPMDAGTPKKTRKLFRLSSYEYPFFDLKARFSRQESDDRGYYSMKRNSRYYIQKIYKKPESKPKYKSIGTAEELTKYPEDHFYEDLNYIDIDKEKNDEKPIDTIKIAENRVVVVKPRMVKIQELFQSFRVPFFRRHEMLEEKPEKIEVEKDIHIYENSDSFTTGNMYDSVHVNRSREGCEEKKPKIPLEDYLEPVQVHRDYCDVSYTSRQKDESLLGYIMSIFENRFGMRRETNDAHNSDSSESESHKAECTLSDEARRPDRARPSMADRPLPVPVENEPYYMNIDRGEAENLLRGQPDGTFVLRPSSQPNHAYTLTVSCANGVHNVGVRRRPDGRLALGFARRGERNFASVTSLLRHHRKRRLLLVAGGGVIGGTTLNETPHYYQTPSSIPLPI